MENRDLLGAISPKLSKKLKNLLNSFVVSRQVLKESIVKSWRPGNSNRADMRNIYISNSGTLIKLRAH